jgi:hypothetical protein
MTKLCSIRNIDRTFSENRDKEFKDLTPEEKYLKTLKILKNMHYEVSTKKIILDGFSSKYVARRLHLSKGTLLMQCLKKLVQEDIIYVSHIIRNERIYKFNEEYFNKIHSLEVFMVKKKSEIEIDEINSLIKQKEDFEKEFEDKGSCLGKGKNERIINSECIKELDEE